MYLLFASPNMCTVWHIPPLIPFSTISSISMPASNSSSTLVSFKHLCHEKTGTKRKQTGSSSYISKHLLLKFSNHQLVTKYHSWHADRDSHLNVESQNFSRLFLDAASLNLWYFPLLNWYIICFLGRDVSLNFSQLSIYSYRYTSFCNIKQNFSLMLSSQNLHGFSNVKICRIPYTWMSVSYLL